MNQQTKTMKSIFFLTLGAIFLLGAEAAEPVHRAKIIAIQGETQQAPEYQISGPRDKSTKTRYWIEIEAEVEVQTTDPSGFIPSLEAKWFAVVMDNYKDPSVPVRLIGTSRYKNINAKDGNIFLSAYIEPDTIERLTGQKKPRDSDIEGYALVLSGPGIVTEGEYGKGLTKATAEKESDWWVTWNRVTLEKMIVPKSRTPFAPLWTSRYPTEELDR